MSDSHGMSLPARVLLRALLNMSLVWLLVEKFAQYFSLTGGFAAIIIVGALLTLMNLFVRPLLNIITLPVKLFATLLAIIIVNGVFVQVTHLIIQNMQENLVTLEIHGGLWGWIVVACLLGFGNWVMKVVL
ncbi:MAG: phage holin family protein [bacterium]|nr:phage holin family protein [bacterium]